MNDKRNSIVPPISKYTTLNSGTLCKSVLFSFFPKGSIGYAEQIGCFGEVTVGMGYGGCDFALFVAGFEFELNVCRWLVCRNPALLR